MPDLGTGEIIIIAIVILILFGSAKLPQAARSLGRSMRIFKSETKGLITDDDDAPKTQPQAQAPPQERPDQAARPEQPAQELSASADDGAITGVPVSKAEQGKQA